MQKSAKQRGINPCNTPDPGFGVYAPWYRDVDFGQILIPKRGVPRAGGFDVVFHFHGHEPVRKEWVKVMTRTVLASVDLGVGSGAYEGTFADPSAFENYIESVQASVARHTKNPKAHIRRIALSAWSAGYGAVEKILEQPLGRRVDAVILLDGLHSGYMDGHVNGMQLKGIMDFAQRATRDRALFFFSHSSIIPPGYASTTETANWLVWSVGGKTAKARPRRNEVMGLELISRYDRGGMHIRGYSGNDTLDHCAHIGLYRDVLSAHLIPRWGLHRRGAP